MEAACPPSIRIRRAVAADWASVAAVHAASWRHAYRGIYSDTWLDTMAGEDRRTYWRENLPSMTGEDDAVFMAVGDGIGPVGFTCLRRRSDPGGPLLDNLHVVPDCKGRGVGRALLAAGAAWLVRRQPEAALQLYAWSANEAARAFYRRLGADELDCFAEATPDGGSAPIVRMAWRRAADLVDRLAPRHSVS